MSTPIHHNLYKETNDVYDKLPSDISKEIIDIQNEIFKVEEVSMMKVDKISD